MPSTISCSSRSIIADGLLQIATVEISSALAEERDREIQQIVNTIVELAQASMAL